MPAWMDNGSNSPLPKDNERELLAKIADMMVGASGLSAPSFLETADPRPSDDKRTLLAKWLQQIQ